MADGEERISSGHRRIGDEVPTEDRDCFDIGHPERKTQRAERETDPRTAQETIQLRAVGRSAQNSSR